MELYSYFDFKKCFKDVLKNTLDNFTSSNDYIDLNHVKDKEEISKINTLFSFILDDKAVVDLLCDYEISEDQDVDLRANYIDLCFYGDTTTHNESGSYQYVFTVDVDDKCFNGLEVINNN